MDQAPRLVWTTLHYGAARPERLRRHAAHPELDVVGFELDEHGGFQEARWQRVLRSALIPVTTGLIIASGLVMAQATGVTWTATAVTGAAAIVMLTTRLNPLWLLAAGGALGGLGFLV